jgi:hypothetical protein
MHGPIKVKFPNNISEWQMGFNSAFKGLIILCCNCRFQLVVQKFNYEYDIGYFVIYVKNIKERF